MSLIAFGLGGSPSELLGLGFGSGSGSSSAAAKVWAYVLPNGKTAGQNLAEINEWMFGLARIHGLVLGTPLVVTPVSRVAGDLVQTISEAGGTVTVERTS
jgi:hypothetical protein